MTENEQVNPRTKRTPPIEENQIYQDRPKEVLGIMRLDKTAYVLVESSKGKTYMDYESFKEHFPALLIDYYSSRLILKKKVPKDS